MEVAQFFAKKDVDLGFDKTHLPKLKQNEK